MKKKKKKDYKWGWSQEQRDKRDKRDGRDTEREKVRRVCEEESLARTWSAKNEDAGLAAC